MSHPTIFELRHFAVTGDLDERFVPHVSACSGCAQRLQRLARSELSARGFEPSVSSAAVRATHPGLFAAMPAFLAVAATMLVLAVIRPVLHGVPMSDSSAEPEGVHGIPSSTVAPRMNAWDDGGSPPGSE